MPSEVPVGRADPKAIANLTAKKAWENPKNTSREEQQKDAFTTSVDVHLGFKTLPNGILPIAAKIIPGEDIQPTMLLKNAIEPKDKDKRMAIWQDIIKSMLHHIWVILWGIDRSEPALLNSPKRAITNIYQRICCRKTPTSQTQKDPMARLVPGRWSKRAVAASADKGQADLSRTSPRRSEPAQPLSRTLSVKSISIST
ncbi:hypothetical protein BGZ65_012663, partial [Modicella reniformis]